jgi:hypothetical protein
LIQSLVQSFTVALGFTIATLSLNLWECGAQNASSSATEKARPHESMNVVLTVSGGFTGIGGKWEIDTSSETLAAGVDPRQAKKLQDLVDQARTDGVLNKDFSKVAENGKTSSGAATSTTQVPADMQTYELTINGERATWSEPAPAGAAAAPPVLENLKQWMFQNTKRQPYRPQ